MSYKVFLFDDDNWLYCSDVTFEDGMYHGWVENGHWDWCYREIEVLPNEELNQ
jgi:hypothetical protein